ncbi:DUF421 domain-containing protein [Halpernia frigidisoli]|uniref:YetF C-terminal domain-containing protein n=1 Tax=Halpernia frigidisoli TaxID=1125876 RepID=A0A1I3HHW5_9FLAO|nr:YetF domain-containing protein [Halpernia frigidisoli]SFI35157.1 Protein of unknown function [Halpernia frigidisoli]
MVDASEYSFDFLKMLFGDFGPLIYLEIFIRVFIIMAYTILIIRWIGKRAVGGLGSADILIIVAMGSAVGDATFYPSVPLSVALLVITLIAAFQKLYIYIGIRHEKVRKITHPKVLKLVENGKLLNENFTIDEIDKNEVYMLLREAGIKYLSEVEHAYYEQSGQLSVFKYENPMKEHSILPEHLDQLKEKSEK